MSNNITLIESEVLDELLEKAILYDLVINPRLIPENTNKDVMIRKANFLSKYIEIPLNANETIAEKLEENYN